MIPLFLLFSIFNSLIPHLGAKKAKMGSGEGGGAVSGAGVKTRGACEASRYSYLSLFLFLSLDHSPFYSEGTIHDAATAGVRKSSRVLEQGAPLSGTKKAAMGGNKRAAEPKQGAAAKKGKR